MTSTRRNLLCIYVCLFSVMLGVGLIVPVLPFQVRRFDTRAATFGAFMATWPLVQLMVAPAWGRLADRWGRRSIFLMGMLGFVISFALYYQAQNLPTLFVARIVSGVLSSATFPIAVAMIADLTTPTQRPAAMGAMGASIAVGMIVGPAVGGTLGEAHYQTTFLLATLSTLVGLGVGVLGLQETLPTGDRIPQVEPLSLTPALISHPQLSFFGLSFVVSFVMSVFESVAGPFGADMYHLGTRQLGMLFAVMGLMAALGQGVVLSRLVHHLGEVRVVWLGALLAGIGFAMVAVTGPVGVLTGAVGIFGAGFGLLDPSVGHLVTRTAAHGSRGAAVGIQQWFDSLGRIVGSLGGGFLYQYHPSIPWWVGAGVIVIYVGATRRTMGRQLTLRTESSR